MSRDAADGEDRVVQLVAEAIQDGGVGPIIKAVQTLEDPDQIRAYVDELTSRVRAEFKPGKSEAEVRKTVLVNISYFFGYMSPTDRPRIEIWMDAVDGLKHPVWGKDVLTPMEEGDEQKLEGFIEGLDEGFERRN